MKKSLRGKRYLRSRRTVHMGRIKRNTHRLKIHIKGINNFSRNFPNVVMNMISNAGKMIENAMSNLYNTLSSEEFLNQLKIAETVLNEQNVPKDGRVVIWEKQSIETPE